VGRLAEAESPERKGPKAEFGCALGALAPQVVEAAPLHDTEQKLITPMVGPVATRCPAEGALHLPADALADGFVKRSANRFELV